MKYIIVIILALISYELSSQHFIAPVMFKDGKWGHINNHNELIISPKYRISSEFSKEGLASVRLGSEYSIINIAGSKMVTEVDNFIITKNWGGFSSFSNGLLRIRIDGKYGFFNTFGKIAIKAKYVNARSFKGGVAIVIDVKKLIILDTSGREVVVPGFIRKINDISEGLFSFISNDNKCGYINKMGEVVIAAKYIKAGDFHNDFAWVQFDDKQYGYINKKGELVFKGKFKAAKDFDIKSGMARVKTKEGWFYISKTGMELFVHTRYFGDFSEGLCEGIKDGKRGFFNKHGEWVIEPKYDLVRKFKNGYAAVKRGGFWGFINMKGELIIDYKYKVVKDMAYIPKL